MLSANATAGGAVRSMNVELQSAPSPQAVAGTFAALVDVLLPGDDDFPAAATTGVQAVILDRLRLRIGWDSVEEIVTFLDAGGQFNSLPESARIERVNRFEVELPDHFAHVRFVTFLAYYESPTVIRALQQLGHDYNDSPLPNGYVMDPFDPRPGFDLPVELKGSYLRTEEIARIDLSSLADLDLPKVVE